MSDKIPTIIFEDKYFIAFNKPSGWITNSSQSAKNNNVLQEFIFNNFDFELAKKSEFRSGIVHRLDKNTSGVILVAKIIPAFEALQLLFKKRQIEKKYLCLAHGRIIPFEGKISAPVGRLKWNRERFGVTLSGKSALTFYKVKSYFMLKKDKSIYSYFVSKPKTGRTHQIRVHFKYIGHPLVSDEFYAGRKQSKKDLTWCPRIFLHAYNISFNHPQKNSLVDIVSDIPPDLKSVFDALERVD